MLRAAGPCSAWRSVVLSLILILALGACSDADTVADAAVDTDTGSDTAVDTLVFCEGGVEMIFAIDDGHLLPFPSDFWLTEDASTSTGYRVNFTNENIPQGEEIFAPYPEFAAQLNRLDGFGTSAAVVFGFAAEIGVLKDVPDEATGFVADAPPSLVLTPDQTVAADSPVMLVGIQEGSPDYGRAIPLNVEYISGGNRQHYLLAEPAYPLRPKTTYAMAVTSRTQDADGHCVSPSAATHRLLATGDVEEFGRLGALTPAAVAVLTAQGFIETAGELAALTVFTTQSIEDELIAAVEEIIARAKAEPPQIIEGSLTMEPSSGGLVLEMYGAFVSTNYLGPDGHFVIEDGKPVAQGTEEIEFQLMIPEITEDHPGPFPLIIYQHGLLGKKEEDGGAKRAHGRAGFVTVSIDAVAHGSRSWDSGLDLTNFFAIDLESGQFDIPVMRDNFRQTYLDIVQLAELAPTLAQLDLLPVEKPDGIPEIVVDDLYITGHSLGALMAGAELGLLPRVRIAAINAGGGSLLNIIRRSDLLGNFILMLKPEDSSMADVYRFMSILQMQAERGDPLNLARLVIDEPPAALTGSAAKHVLFQEVEADTFMPNWCNEGIARSLGMAHLAPTTHAVFGLEDIAEPASLNHPAGVTSVFFQFDWLNGKDGLVKAVHTESYADPIPQAQWIHFFETYRDTGVPEVIDPYRLLGIQKP